MPIRMNCPACMTQINVPEEKRGRKVRCRKCEEIFTVPEVNGKKKRAEDSSIQSGRKVNAAAARNRKDDDNDDGDDDRPVKKKTPAKAGASGMMLAIGGVAAVLLLCLLGGGGIGAYFVMFRSKPAEVLAQGDPKNADKNNLVANPENKDKPENPVPKNDPPKNNPPIADPDAGKPLPEALAPEMLATVKKATAYLHVIMPSGVTAEGSGFFAVDRGIIITNAHVLGMLLESNKPPKQVAVVQDSGLPTETKMVGDVLGVDRVSDLAVIRVPDNPNLPPPLTLASEAPAELQKVYIFGFPFGESLGKNVTINENKINALRPDPKTGALKDIQIDGGMNPGNSGGPVVNTRGNLVGVSVAGIPGAQITFAIPAEKVRQIMEGRVTHYTHGDAFQQQGKAQMPVRVRCLDPLNKIRELRMEVWTGPPGESRPTSAQAPQPVAGDGPKQEHLVKYGSSEKFCNTTSKEDASEQTRIA